MYVLTIPDDMGNLYDYPEGALNEIRRVLSKDMDLYIEGPSKVGLFMYDNRTFVVENFNDEPVEITVVGDPDDVKLLKSLISDEEVAPAPAPQAGAMGGFWARYAPRKASFKITLKPHSYKAYSY